MVFADIRSFVALAGVGSPSARASFSVSVSSSEVHCRWGMCSHCWRVPHTQGDCTLLVPGKTWEGLDGTTYEYFATCPVIDQVNTLLSVPGQAVRAVAQRQVSWLWHAANAKTKTKKTNSKLALAASNVPCQPVPGAHQPAAGA